MKYACHRCVTISVCTCMSGMTVLISSSNSKPCRKPVAVYVAKYDYDNMAENHLSFRKGEIMYVTDQSDEGWWLAKSWNGEQTGYVPSNYLAKWNTLNAEE